MSIVNNPYSDMLTIMQEQGSKNNPPTIRIGTVISSAPSLIVSMGDLQIDNDNIIAFDGYTALQAGDAIVVIPSTDGQKYFILCKVVDLSGG